MSACSCDYGECLGMRIGGPFTARKKGHNCEVCGVLVKPGETCVDVAGLDGDLQVLAHPGQPGHRVEQLVRHPVGVGGEEAEAVQTLDLVQAAK